ncbi:NAD-dependent epimerase/dehydratase family protein [Aureimonas sp. OT7]|uniref:NAD-dependent epimerase/dehydratase family protein n=1 Tax=Aureimonas sp. OT7 TaxID=2816454 RepID=UPI00177CA2FE|nr:NAD-dependent epimerase/dehydratase family protein [Aureimonas sp. OT7]QOG05829.1 NAD-dependent epimerase/dehydratase family protein [Aureimonas sp. OT7]
MRDGDGDRILVTGASGFIAKHIVLKLLQSGHRVRGTVRDFAKGEALQQTMVQYGAPVDRLSVVVADLTRDKGWDEAVSGCHAVLHTASPFPVSQPSNKFALVPAARDGTIRVCRAAAAQGVRRVVLTSSVASIMYGHPPRTTAFGEADFSNVDSDLISPYAVSKTLAEKAAREVLAQTETELVTINPSLVFGPLLDGVAGTSARIVAMMMNGRVPALPNVRFGIVDVRDVAEAHVRAIDNPEVAGRRFLVSADTVPLRDITQILARAYPAYARRLYSWSLPDWAVRAAARVSRRAAMLAGELGNDRRLDTAPARDMLGIRFRSVETAAVDLAASLIRFGLVRPPAGDK